MGSFKHQDCVDSLQCEVFEKNLVEGQEQLNCWETAQQVKDFRFMYNICHDCIVYLFARKNNLLTSNEMNHIITKRDISCFHSKSTA